jgi:hypothetical protein
MTQIQLEQAQNLRKKILMIDDYIVDIETFKESESIEIKINFFETDEDFINDLEIVFKNYKHRLENEFKNL